MREQTAKGKHLRRVTVQHESCRWLFYIRFFDQFLIRNPMFIEPKRLQFVQEAAAQILDSALQVAR
jgi:hypothetical protein